MILYTIRCDAGHDFDAWFRDSAAWDDQRARGLVSCPSCGSTGVSKAPMTPGVARRGESSLEDAAKKRAALAELRRAVEASTEDVGAAFPARARAMHNGECDKRAIRGQASLEEARAMHEEGVPIMPLPDFEPGDA